MTVDLQPGSSRSASGRLIFLLPAWFAGARLRTLARYRSETTFYNAAGLAVVALSLWSGTAVCIAMGYRVGQPPAHLWPLGLAWAVLMACVIERLVLMTVATASKRVLAVITLLRATFMVLLALLVTEPFLSMLNDREITNYLSEQHGAEVTAVQTAAGKKYDGTITGSKQQIDTIRADEADLKRNVAEYKFMSGCETTLVVCLKSGDGSCSASCKRYVRLARNAQRQFDGRYAGNRGRIAGLRKAVRTAEADKQKMIDRRVSAIEGDTGLSARQKALAALQKEDPAINIEVWRLRLLFFFVDVLPFTAVLLRSLSGSPYEKAIAAEMRADMLGAVERDAQTHVRKQTIEEEARAESEFQRFLIRLRLQRRMDEAENEWTPPRTHGDDPLEEPIDAPSWDEYATGVERNRYEDRPVTVNAGLRRGALIGLSLIGGMGALTLGLQTLFDLTITGSWLVFVAFALATALAVYTGGYRRASAWALHAMFATLVVGLLLPIALVGLNL